MSTIWEYVASLLPNTTRDIVIDDLRNVQNELKTTTLVVYKDAVPLFKRWKPASKDIEFKQSYFIKTVKTKSSSESMIECIYKSLLKLEESLEAATECTIDMFNKEISGVALSYRKANILQYIECAHFVVNYARAFLIYLYNEEQKANGTDAEIYDLLKYDVKYIDKQWMDFIMLIELFNKDVVNKYNFRKTVDNIPDIVVSKDNLQTLNATVGKDKLDPFQFGFLSVKWNPIFHVRIKIAEYQARKYKKALKEREALELRRMLLELQRDGKQNAKLEAQLGYVKDEIDDITRDIVHMEEKNG